MTDDIAIRVENLAKKYRIEHGTRQSYTALRDVIADTARSFFRGRKSNGDALTLTRSTLPKHEEFWALRDISFEVKRGDVVGVIGRNGAGKSTLLKVLSRITEPTTGRVQIKGRVASLLEVGTGFHPELTGRENIFLNGAILGMSRTEIKRKFDEIVAFAEVERFLDTPVKRYSSGMHVRLAFSVAAHLEPEILIVDEVLAVGDAEFQKKCLGKMQGIARGGGRTVLFVSHNMAAVRHLCSTCMYLVAGQLKHTGPVQETIDRYLASSTRERETGSICRNGLELLDFKLCAPDSGLALTSAVFGEDYELRFTVHGSLTETKVAPVIRLYDDSGTLVSSICGPEEGVDFAFISGTCEWVVRMPTLQLFPGRYSVAFQMFGYEPEPLLEAADVLEFTVEAALLPGALKSYRSDHGLIRVCSSVSVSEAEQ